MTTLKTMGIIGLIIAGLSFMCMYAFCNSVDWEAGMGWGYIAVYYLIALSIVVLVQVKKFKK